MATFTRVQHNSTNPGTTAASLTATLASGVTSGNLLVATITVGTNVGTVTPPAGWVQAGPTESVTSNLQQQIWYLIVGTGGATSFTFSWSGAHSFGWTIDEWNSSTGWDSSTVDSSAGAVHTTTSTAVNCGSPAASAQASELWYGVLSWANSGQTLSGVTAGWTTGDSSVFSGNNTSQAYYQTRTTTGTPTLAATLSAAQLNAGVVATFKSSSSTTHSGGAGLSGSGTLGATGTVPGQLVVSKQTVDQVTTVSGVATSTNSFSPPAGSLVQISAAWLDNTDQLGKTFTCVDNHGNSYSFANGGQGGDADGGCYLLPFQFQYSTAPGATHVTITASGTGATAAADCLIQPYIVTQQNADQSTAAHNKFSEVGTATTTYEIAVTPTVLGSVMFVLAAPNHNSGLTGPVTPVATTITDIDWDDSVAGSRGTVGRSASFTTALTSTTYGWTSVNSSPFGYGVMAVEVIPVTTVTPTPSLTGTGTLGATGLALVPGGTAGLSGSGVLGGTDAHVTVPGHAGLSGHGDLTPTGTSTGAKLAGRGDLGATGTVTKHGTAGLAGVGNLTPVEMLAELDGAGTLGALGVFVATVAMAGAGSFGITGETLGYVAGLAGVGALGAYEQVQFSALAGVGTLGITGEHLGFVAGLFGVGSLSIPQVAGGLVAGVGGAGTPLALPGSSQVAVAPPGSTNWQWIGTLGHVTSLKYSYVCPGGCDKMTCTVMVPATYRNQMLSPGWQVKITRGAHDVWHGKLDEPQPSPSGWTLTAVGNGTRAADFVAFYAPGDTWPTGVPDDIINRAIGRGLPWTNPGLAGNPNYSQFWLGQQFDPGSQNITAFLNLICTRGGLVWYVNSQPGGIYGGDDLNIIPLPTTVNRLLVVNTPVARTLGGDINYILIKYMATADDTTATPPVVASYNYVAATSPQSILAHGEMETYIDLSDVGVQTLTQAQGVGNYVLQIYQRASFAGPFQASHGMLLTTGGQAIDPGTDQAGTVVRLILTDFGYGGEVTPQFPVEFIVGAYEWDDFAQVATITPYQTVDQSLTGLLSLENTILKPVQAGG